MPKIAVHAMADEVAAFKALRFPATLTMCMDQEAKQRAGVNYLIRQLRLSVVGLRDCHHRAWNDVSAAVRRSKLWSVFMHSTFIFNISFGPWGTQSWLAQQQEQAADLVECMSPHDPLLMKMWAHILLDHGHIESDLPDSIAGPEARASFIESLAFARAFTVKGSSKAWPWRAFPRVEEAPLKSLCEIHAIELPDESQLVGPLKDL